MATQDNKNAYIPPAVEKQMAAHLESSLPQNLQKYQQQGAAMPAHAEQAIAGHLSKNLPAHMQEYVEPYMHQNVVFGAGSNVSGTSSAAPSSSRRALVSGFKAPRQNNPYNPAGQPVTNDSTSGSTPNPANPYDFILNPEKAPPAPLFSGSHSKLLRSLIVGGGLILLIIIVVVGLNILGSAGRAQKQRFIEVAQTQTEIVRIAEAAKNKIGSPEVTDVLAMALISTRSSLQETGDILKKRGAKDASKQFGGGRNPANDQLLIQAEANSNFDETYTALLKKQLDNYQIQIRAAATAATPEEKTKLAILNEQIELLKTRLSEVI